MAPDELIENLEHRMDFVISFFNALANQPEWREKEEGNNLFISRCVTQLHRLAEGGRLREADARRVHKAAVEAGVNYFFHDDIKCLFGDGQEVLLINRMLFQSIMGYAQNSSFEEVLRWSNDTEAFREAEFPYLSQWFEQGALDLKGIASEDIISIISDLLQIVERYKMREMGNQVYEYIAKELSMEQQLEIARNGNFKDRSKAAADLLKIAELYELDEMRARLYELIVKELPIERQADIPLSNIQEKALQPRWFHPESLELKKIEPNDLTRVIGKLLKVAELYKLDALKMQLIQFIAKDLTIDHQVDIALSCGKEEILSLVNDVLKGYCEGVRIRKNLYGKGKDYVLDISHEGEMNWLWDHENDPSVRALFDVFAKHPLCIRLQLSDDELVNRFDVIKSFAAVAGSSVRRLSVRIAPSPSEKEETAFSSLIALLPLLKKMEQLQLEAWECDGIKLNHFVELAKKCPPLSQLALDGCKEAHQEVVIPLIECAGEKLTHLRLNSCGMIGDEVAKAISAHCPNIETFFFDSGSEESLSDFSEEALIDMFGSCMKLRTLQFWNSIHSPAAQGGNPYDLGIINVLERLYPDRVIHIDYAF